MSPVSEAVTNFAAAVRAGDRTATSALVDWPASGVARMVRALADAEPSERAALARQGLSALNTEGVGEPIALSWLAPCVDAEVSAELATAEEAAAARASLDAPGIPPEVDDETSRSLAAIATRASGVVEVYALRCGDRTPCLLATGRDISGLAVARKS
jgi:hypothetical protein